MHISAFSIGHVANSYSMYDYDPEMPLNSISEDLFFKIFLRECPLTLACYACRPIARKFYWVVLFEGNVDLFSPAN